MRTSAPAAAPLDRKLQPDWVLYARDQRKQVHARIDQLAARDGYSQTINQAVAGAQAAINAAIMASTVAATTAATASCSTTTTTC
jgi:hypothetical protein